MTEESPDEEHTDGAGPAGTGPVQRLRDAMGALEDTGPAFDPAEHADRFEAVHDALVAVLADVDRG